MLAALASGFAIAAALLVLAPVAATAQDDCLVLTDFSKDPVGAFPPDWKVRKDAGKAVYSVQEENGRRHLHAAARGLGIQAALEHEWDLDAYPILAWSWRPRLFPAGETAEFGDQRQRARGVHARALLAHPGFEKAVKYIWSERVPVDTRGLSSNGGLTQVRVLRSGTEKRDQWVDGG